MFAILQQGGSHLMLDALEATPRLDTDRERRVKRGRRGLGDAIGLAVDELDATYSSCVASGCTITCEPTDELWGDRVFACLDPFGYEWEFSQPIADIGVAYGFAAVRASWFGLADAEGRS